MKIILNQKKCLGCGACAIVCPKLFSMDKNNKAYLISNRPGNPKTGLQEIKTAQSACAQEAADGCPTRAITVNFDF